MTHSSNTREKSSAAATSAVVRSAVLPDASYDCIRIAESPVVEVFGLVLEILNEPHSGLPTLAQPAGSAQRRSRSEIPISAPGQPSARAIVSGTPNTTGVWVNDTGSPTRAGEAAAATRSVHTVEAGDQRLGHRRSFSSGQSPPAVRIRVASPEDTLMGRTVAQVSRAAASGDSLNAFASASSMLTFSEDVATTTFVQPSSAKSPPPTVSGSASEPKHPVKDTSAAAITAPTARERRSDPDVEERVGRGEAEPRPGAMRTA